MSTIFSDEGLPTNAAFLAEAVPIGLSLAHVTTSLLVLNAHDPLPRVLATDFGFTQKEQERCRAIREIPELLQELRADLPAMHRYVAVARLALESPPIWATLSSSFQAEDTPEERRAALEVKYRNSCQCMEAALHLIRRVTAEADTLREELHLQQLALQSLFARLGHTIRAGIAPYDTPDASEGTPFGLVSPEQAQLLLLAVSLIDHLPLISDHAFIHGLSLLSFVQASIRLPLYKRLIELPPATELHLSEVEALTLYQAAQVTQLALLVELTPEGTWADWVASQILTPDPPQPYMSTYDQEQLDRVNTTGPAELQAYCERVRKYFGPDHPDLARADAEIRALTEQL
ncbi:hypothetical protein [Hymenobacter chitinivorans]|uniref:Uncharacterized protein n=1 Tax=Hymenobacter chitinivorans DSM 11115 TaxID=1121954 RepID=A0A2M9BA31_9BACT|nr:hypothetical protein [Hymenobacter chitinivorans]PJJ54799.1 hypothetical protein CLV45_3145 [Hymenobacter chitinivorans DSM 11115]